MKFYNVINNYNERYTSDILLHGNIQRVWIVVFVKGQE